MNKTLIAATVAGIVLLASNAQAQTVPEGYQLQQVLMMSRHNLRAPLANNGSVLEQSTPNKWPEWDVPGGQLTTKGGVLEVYMGHYMREWLAEQGMVKSGECPPPDTVYAYANSLQRTVATAQFFITGAFPGCDIPVHHQEKMGTMDPTFNPVITDDSAAFSEQAVAAMEKELSKLQLTDSYKLLEQIVNYKDSPACKEKQQCSGNGVELGANVIILGDITIGNNVTVGAGSVVLDSVPDNALVVGEKARVKVIK